MYYNTNGERGDELNNSRSQSVKQEDFILGIFNAFTDGLTPSQVKAKCLRRRMYWPLTSIRRAISTLTKAGKLTKTDELRIGLYRKNEHIWRINND